MSRRLIDILPKIPQYEDIPYAADFECPECGKTGFFDYDWGPKHENPKLVGWCDTNIGKMGVLNAPVVRDIDSTVLLGPGLQMMMSLTDISTIWRKNVPTGKRLKNNLVNDGKNNCSSI